MFFDWIGQNHYWSGVATIVLEVAFSLWLAAAIARSRRWAFVVLAYQCVRGLLPWIGYLDRADGLWLCSLAVSLVLLLWCVLRVGGHFEPRTPPDP